MPDNSSLMIINRLRKYLQSRYFIPVCLTSSFIIRLLWISLFKIAPTSDFGWYLQRGLSIAAGTGFTADGAPTAFWPVGYPGFLSIIFSIFGGSLFWPKLANIFLYLAIILLIYFFSKRIFQNEEAARITVLILAFYPNHIAYSSLLASEILFTLLIVLGALLFIASQKHPWLLIVVGLCLGIATLVKPQAILVPILFIAIYYKNIKMLLKSGAIIYLMLLLTIAPWMVRNYMLFGEPVLTTNGGRNLLIGNSPYSDGSYIWTQEMKSLLADSKDEMDSDIIARKFAIDYMVHNPLKIMMLWPRKIFYLYAIDFDGIFYNQPGWVYSSMIKGNWGYTTLKIIAQLYYMLTMILFLFSIRFIFSADNHSWIGLLIIIYFTLIAIAFFGTPRFHFPAIPWIAVYSGIGGRAVLNHFSPRIAAI